MIEWLFQTFGGFVCLGPMTVLAALVAMHLRNRLPAKAKKGKKGKCRKGR